MKTIGRGTNIAAALACTLAFTFARAAEVTPAEVRAIARDAYIFTYPLALQYRTMYVQAIDRTSKEYVGGFGKYPHYGMSTPDNRDIVIPIKLYLSRENMKTDHLNRTVGVVIGQWGNDTRQAVYQGWPLDADGSLTIYIQHDSLGADKEGNWLPAPASPFSAVLRVYGPGDGEQAGQWKSPALERVK